MSCDLHTEGSSYHVLAARVSCLVCIPRALHIISHVRDGCVLTFADTRVYAANGALPVACFCF